MLHHRLSYPQCVSVEPFSSLLALDTSLYCVIHKMLPQYTTLRMALRTSPDILGHRRKLCHVPYTRKQTGRPHSPQSRMLLTA